MATLPVPAKYVPAKRNKGKLLKDNNNFLYNLSRKDDSRSFWFCSKKKGNGCSVTATVLIKSEDEENGAADEILSIQ